MTHLPWHSPSRCLAAVPVLWSLIAAGSPAAPHPHSDILATVESAALHAAMDDGHQEVEVRVRPLDQRLQPAQCGQALDTVRPHAGRSLGPVSYGVRCAGPEPWTLYLRAEVSASVELPVLARPLPRGALIAPSDIDLQRRRITRSVAGLITDPADAVGKELKRPLAAGAELRYGQVALPELVARGQTVTLVAGSPGVEVRMQGKALASGAEGDRLMVSNLRSGRRVEGIVLSDGSVQIP
jgi:flagella basal body P-ring formation protein FlgA